MVSLGSARVRALRKAKSDPWIALVHRSLLPTTAFGWATRPAGARRPAGATRPAGSTGPAGATGLAGAARPLPAPESSLTASGAAQATVEIAVIGAPPELA